MFRLALATAPAVSAVVVPMITPTAATAEEKQQELRGADFYDKDFDQYVDLRLFGVAWRSLDAKLMADIALQLREAESVLKRKHEMITADQMLGFAKKMASESKDAETLERLARVAKASGKADEAGEIEQLISLASSSRDLRGDEMFSVEDIGRGAPSAFGNMILQVRAAELSGDKETLKSLRKAVDELESFRQPHRNRLYGLIDDANDLVGDGQADETSDLLKALTGASRDFYTGVVPPKQQEKTAAVIVTPGGGGSTVPTPGASGIKYSSATGGMRYLQTPSGAVVQSHGRLGTILFEPGDVILSIGGVPISYGNSVDGGVNSGYLSNNRSVVVRDRNSGRVLTLYY